MYCAMTCVVKKCNPIKTFQFIFKISKNLSKVIFKKVSYLWLFLSLIFYNIFICLGLPVCDTAINNSKQSSILRVKRGKVSISGHKAVHESSKWAKKPSEA